MKIYKNNKKIFFFLIFFFIYLKFIYKITFKFYILNINLIKNKKNFNYIKLIKIKFQYNI